MEMSVRIDDRQVQRFLKESPQRADWALKEAFRAAGGHIRKLIRNFIEKGGEGWRPLSPMSRKAKIRTGQRTTPLHFMARFIRFKYSKRKGQHKVRIGFFPSKNTSKAFQRKNAYATDSMGNPVGPKYTLNVSPRRRNKFREAFGQTPQAFARKHEYGKTRRVTKAMRGYFAATGTPLKRTTKKIKLPARPFMRPVWRREQAKMFGYISKKFFKVFFSNKKRGLKF
jgi:hypothetical protein